MEVKHPDQSRVKALVEELLQESRKNVAEWHVEMMEYDFYSSFYQIRLSLEKNSAVAKVPSEMFDEIWNGGDKFKRRRVKNVLKDAVENFYKLEEE